MNNKHTVKSISLLWIGSLAGAGFAFFTQVFLARELGPNSFGIFGASLALVVMVTPLASFGVGTFWLKVFGEEGWGGIRWLQSSLIFTFLTTFIVLVAIVLWAMLGPHDVTTRKILILLSTYLLGQVALELVSAKLQLEERYSVLAFWLLLPHFLRLILIFSLAWLVVDNITLSNSTYAYMAISISMFSFGLFVLWRMKGGHLSLRGHGARDIKNVSLKSTASVSEVVFQVWPFGLAGFFHLIYFQSDIILLKYLQSDESAGIYNVVFVTMAAVYLLPSVIYQKYLLPKIHRWASHDRSKFYRVYRTGNKVMLGLGILAMLSIWLLSPWGVPYLFGENYGAAVVPLSILGLAAPFRFLATSVGSTLVTGNHMRRKVCYMGVTAMVNVGLNFLLIPIYGAIGAAIATVLSEIFLLIVYFWGARIVFKRDES